MRGKANKKGMCRYEITDDEIKLPVLVIMLHYSFVWYAERGLPWRSKYGSVWVKSTFKYTGFDAILRDWCYGDTTQESQSLRSRNDKDNRF